LDVLRDVRQIQPTAEILVITGYGSVGTAVTAMKEGAYDYLTKPVDPEYLVRAINKACERRELRQHVGHLQDRFIKEVGLDKIVAVSPSMQRIIQTIQDVAETEATVLIEGESGTGKELMAKLIHEHSKRSAGPFLAVNCGAMPEDLLESELFGHMRGSFTGAHKNHKGLFEAADGGTLFLDEIAETSQNFQVKLLRTLQERSIRRLGDTQEAPVDVRLIAATNQDLQKAIAEKRFREDLYYRLNIIRIEIPPLRERREDIPLLTKHFVHKYEQELKIEEPFTLDGGLRKLFQSYHWPGNVRELSSVILRLMVGDDPEWIKTDLINNIEADGLPLPTDFVSQRAEKGVVKSETSSGPDALSSLKALKAEAIRHIEQKAIMYALNMTGWNKRQTAKMLGISYKALFYKMDNLGIRNPR